MMSDFSKNHMQLSNLDKRKNAPNKYERWKECSQHFNLARILYNTWTYLINTIMLILPSICKIKMH